MTDISNGHFGRSNVAAFEIENAWGFAGKLLQLAVKTISPRKLTNQHYRSVKRVSTFYKGCFTYISQTKSCDFVVPTRSCNTDVLREDDSQLC